MKAQQITQFDRGQKAATDSLSVVLASDGDAAISRARVLPKFEPLTITDETVVIPAPALGTDQLYLTYVCVQNKVAESPCDILLQDALTANTPTKIWTIDAPVKGGGISEAYPANLGILWPPGKPLVIKPVPAQAVTVAIAYQTLDANYYPKSSGVVSAPNISAPNMSAIADQNRTADSSAFSLTPTNTGGTADSWSASGLPTGFSIDSSTGTITGTLDTVATNTITVTATNATGSDSESFDLIVTAVPAGVSVPTPVWDLDFSHDTQGVYNGGFGKFERWNDENNADFWQQTDVNRRPNLSGNTLLNGKFVAIFDGSDVLTPSVLKTCQTMFVLLNTSTGSGRSAGVAPLFEATSTSGDPNNQGYNHVLVRGATEANTAENYNIRMDARALGGQASVDGGPISATSTQAQGSSIYLGLTPAQSYGTHIWMAQPVIPYEISKIGFFAETNGGSFADFYLKGNIGQVKFFAERLTQAQIDYVYGEMMWDWGLQSQLPVGHPYKNAAPT